MTQYNLKVLVGLFLLTGLAIFSGMLGSYMETEFSLLERLVYNGDSVGIRSLDSTNVSDIINDCNNKGRIDKNIECVQSHLTRFYIYKIREDNEVISFRTLFNDGGDCANWSDLWEYIAGEFGYNIRKIHIPVNESVAHRLSFFSNDQGYCLVDMLYVDCFIYG